MPQFAPLYYLFKVSIVSLSIVALFYDSTVSSSVSDVTILYLQGSMDSLSVCYVTALFYRLRLSLPLFLTSLYVLSLQDFHCFIFCLLRHCSVLGFDCLVFCLLRHHAFSSRFLLMHYVYVTSLLSSRL